MYFLQITKGSPPLVTSCPMSTVYRIIRINIFLDYYKRHGDRYILRNRSGPPDKRELFRGLCLFLANSSQALMLSANCCWELNLRVGRFFFVHIVTSYQKFLHPITPYSPYTLSSRRIFQWLLLPFHLHSSWWSQIIDNGKLCACKVEMLNKWFCWNLLNPERQQWGCIVPPSFYYTIVGLVRLKWGRWVWFERQPHPVPPLQPEVESGMSWE